jgi:hypothetical protein
MIARQLLAEERGILSAAGKKQQALIDDMAQMNERLLEISQELMADARDIEEEEMREVSNEITGEVDADNSSHNSNSNNNEL